MNLSVAKKVCFTPLFTLLCSLGIGISEIQACTRMLYVGSDDQIVLTGRTLDWAESIDPEIYVLPAGLNRSGGTEENPLVWTSLYGSVGTVGYHCGVVDGLNEKGLSVNALFLPETDYGRRDPSKPGLSVFNWGNYLLDNFATVQEVVDALSEDGFQVQPETLRNGRSGTLHLALSDVTGDSALLEYINGELHIYHDRSCIVLANSPTFDHQQIIGQYWSDMNGDNFLPGTNKSIDRFTRARYYLERLPKRADERFSKSVPNGATAQFDTTSLLSALRAVSVPLGLATQDQPELSSTTFRSISDQTNLIYFFDSATNPNLIYVDLKALNLAAGASVMKLNVGDASTVLSGDVTTLLQPTDDLFF